MVHTATIGCSRCRSGTVWSSITIKVMLLLLLLLQLQLQLLQLLLLLLPQTSQA